MFEMAQATLSSDCEFSNGSSRMDCSNSCCSTSSFFSPSPTEWEEGEMQAPVLSPSPVLWKEVCTCPLCLGYNIPSLHTGYTLVNAIIIQPQPDLLRYPNNVPSPYEDILKFWPKLPFGIESNWITQFAAHFKDFFAADRHSWSLRPLCGTKEPSDDLGKFHVVLDAAKVRFCCDKKGHGWTSMKGLVTFWYRLRRSPDLGIAGEVLFKLYGQKCEKCITRKINSSFEEPMWYSEEIDKVLLNLKNKVGFTYYGFPQICEQALRRKGKPSRPHRSELCQACRDGECREKK